MTDRSNANLISETSGDLLKQVINSMTDSVLFKDIDGKYLGCNREYEKLIGRQESELIGKTVQEVYQDRLPDTFLDTDRVVQETKQPIKFESWLTKADGTEALIETSKSPLFNHKGEMIGIIAVFRDITKQKEAEEALKASEEKFRFITENTSDVLWTLDIKTHKFTYLSPAAQDNSFPIYDPYDQVLRDLVFCLNSGNRDTVIKSIVWHDF